MVVLCFFSNALFAGYIKAVKNKSGLSMDSEVMASPKRESIDMMDYSDCV